MCKPFLPNAIHFSLYLIASPVVDIEPEQQSVTLKSPQDSIEVNFTCTARAIPPASITWMVSDPENEKITIGESSTVDYTTTSTLTVTDVEFADRGEIICVAENLHDVARATAELIVYGKHHEILY